MRNEESLMPYAKDTAVSAARTKAEIEDLLTRYGVTGFYQGWHTAQEAHLAFEFRGRQYRVLVPLPAPDERRFTYSRVNQYDSGTRRAPEAARKAHQQAVNEQWRAVGLWLKATLVAVDQGIITFEAAFLPHLLIPTTTGKQTVYEWVDPQVGPAYATGRMPALLPGSPGAPHYLPSGEE
jgi:hypothetical protein